MGDIEMNWLSILFILGGLFATAAAVFNWDWFMNARKARFMVKILTRNGTRIFYGLLGLALIVLGILGLTGVVDLQT